MKCPKCDYLGFETGDRCKNCGYDFSLLFAAENEPADYEIHPASIDEVPVHMVNDGLGDVLNDTFRISMAPEAPGDDHADLELGTVEESPSRSAAALFASAGTTSHGPLPLFTPAQPTDDEPLIKLPAAPRPPLAVRRTPDTPRLRAVPRPVARPTVAPVLEFADEADRRVPPADPSPTPGARASSAAHAAQPGRTPARVVALMVDYLILLGIDAAVVYFTVRMAGLSPEEWRLLPIAPMVAFLGLLKVAYFYAFTAVGGQTIGKMAVGTCVVSENGGPVDAARAMRRTSAGVLSFLLFGLGFIPSLFGDHRALHDRLAGTRVIRLRSV